MDWFVLAFFVIVLWWYFSRKSKRNSTIPMDSFTDDSTSYELNPQEVTCTCPDWRTRRSMYAATDPRRLCKHLAHAYAETPAPFPSPLHRYRDDFTHYASIGKGFSTYREPRVLEVGMERIECWVSQNNPWINVYIGMERYGFNPDIGRWAKGKEPANVDQISLAIIDEVG